jgi:deuterolysin
MQTTNLDSSVFTPLEAGQTIEVEIDAAELHDLSTSGTYDIESFGAIPYAEIGSTELTGDAVTFTSNKLSLAVDGAEASKVKRAIHSRKRTVLSSDCTGAKLTAVRSALSNCVSLANAAATAATSGSASKFQEYFKTTSSSTRSTVAARLRAVASDCGSTTSGRTSTHCVDTYQACSSNVLAYTVPSQNYIVYCNLFFSALPGVSSGCHSQDQATTVIHEETHAPGVYSPGTQDLGYGYAAATRLSANSALNNADQYALYANAIYVGC